MRQSSSPPSASSPDASSSLSAPPRSERRSYRWPGRAVVVIGAHYFRVCRILCTIRGLSKQAGFIQNGSGIFQTCPGSFKKYTNEKGNYDKAKMLEVRKGTEASALLLIYIIDKDSPPSRNGLVQYIWWLRGAVL